MLTPGPGMQKGSIPKLKWNFKNFKCCLVTFHFSMELAEFVLLTRKQKEMAASRNELQYKSRVTGTGHLVAIMARTD